MNRAKEKLSTTVKICLVGCGRMGTLRLQLMRESSKVDCVAIVEPDRSRPVWSNPPPIVSLVAPTASAPDAPPPPPPLAGVYATLADVRERFDAIWIAAPTEAHPRLIEEAAARTRFVFCEAPVATAEAAVKRCYDACAGRGVELVCGWSRRFDEGFVSLHDRSQRTHVTSATFVDKEGLTPPGPQDKQQQQQQQQQPEKEKEKEKEPPLGSIFRDLMAHDFNLALMFMNEQMPLSVQATVRDTYGTGTFDSAWCNLEYSCGKSVFIEASRYGRDKFENSVRLVAGGETVTSGKDDEAKSFPARYAKAFRSELSHFARRCGLEKVQQRCPKEACIATAQLVQIAEQSAAVGSKIPVAVGPTANLLQVESGDLARHLREKVLSQLSFCKIIASVGGSGRDDEASGMSLTAEVSPLLERRDIDSVHVCLEEYKMQPEVVEACLIAGKKVLCQPPLLDLHRLQQVAIEKDSLLMLEFHRRFDRQFQRAKEFVTQLATDGGTLATIVIEDTEGVSPASPQQQQQQQLAPSFDAADAIWGNCVHDLDMLSWLLEDIDCEITVRSVRVTTAGAIAISLPVWLRKFDKIVEASIAYFRCGHTPVNNVVVNGQPFGHDSRKTPVTFPDTYDDAHEREFKFFASQPGNVTGQGKYCLTYSRGFDLATQAVEIIRDEGADLRASELASPKGHIVVEDPEPGGEFGSFEPGEDQFAGETDEALPLGSSPRGVPRSAPAPAAALSPRGRTAVQAAAAKAAQRAAEQDAAVKEFRGVAGHGGMFTQGGRIYKPLVYEENEWLVYEAIRMYQPDLLPWIPRVYERTVVNGSPFLVMEDLTYGYQRPAVLDLKVGEPSDFYRMHNQPYAMKVAGYTGDSIIRRSQQSWNDLVSYFKDFIKDKETANSRYEVLPDFIEQLGQLLDIFNRQTLLRMRAISLLFIYDCTDVTPQRPAVRIIDMARAKIMVPLVDHPDRAQSPSPAILLSAPAPSHLVSPHLAPPAPGAAGTSASASALAPTLAPSTLSVPTAGAPEHGLIVRPPGSISPRPPTELASVLPMSTDNIDHHFAFGLENCIKLLKSIHEKFVNRHAVFLCRHGPEAAPDALSVEGLQQAYDMAARLKHEKISIIVSSPKHRAVQTARLLAEQLSIKYVIEPAMVGLQEEQQQQQQQQQPAASATVPSVSSAVPISTAPLPLLLSTEQPDPFLDREYVPACSASDPPPLTLPALQQRVYGALSKICSKYRRVSIVGHTSTFVALLSTLVGQQFQGPLHFASITSLVPRAGSPLGWGIERMNMSSHLTVFRDRPSQALPSLTGIPPSSTSPTFSTSPTY